MVSNVTVNVVFQLILIQILSDKSALLDNTIDQNRPKKKHGKH